MKVTREGHGFGQSWKRLTSLYMLIVGIASLNCNSLGPRSLPIHPISKRSLDPSSDD